LAATSHQRRQDRRAQQAAPSRMRRGFKTRLKLAMVGVQVLAVVHRDRAANSLAWRRLPTL
jgi:hypothetical protein